MLDVRMNKAGKSLIEENTDKSVMNFNDNIIPVILNLDCRPM